jgi:hypothetical protein
MLMNTKKVSALKLFGLQYCQIDIDGGATAFFSTTIDQTGCNENDEANNDDTAHGENEFGWATYSYWITGFIRYQGDQKLHGGSRRHDLRTLVLSEVQGCESVSAT